MFDLESIIKTDVFSIVNITLGESQSRPRHVTDNIDISRLNKFTNVEEIDDQSVTNLIMNRLKTRGYYHAIN